MIKNIPKVIAILLAIATIIFLSMNIYTNKDIGNNNDNDDVGKENKEVIEKLDLSFMEELEFLEDIKQIDDDNYLLFVRQGSVTSSLLYNYTIYKYNIENGVHLININIDKGYEFCGIDKENKLVLSESYKMEVGSNYPAITEFVDKKIDATIKILFE